LFQWLGSWKAALHKKYGAKPTAGQQFQFTWDELHTFEGKFLADLLYTTSSFGAGVGFDNDFERNGGGWWSQNARGAHAPMMAPLYAHRAHLGSSKSGTMVHTAALNVNVTAKNADARAVVKQTGQHLAAAIHAGLGATGLG
jgi:hypothetical protein